MELIQVKDTTYYIKNPTNIGVIKVDEESVYFIDSGNDKDAGKKILKIVEEAGWKVRGIILTHSHADHIGGSAWIQNKTGCKIFAKNIERVFTEYPVLEPTYLYGACPFFSLHNKFLEAKPSFVLDIKELTLEDFEILSLPGHSFDMIGIRTRDDVCFLGDALFSEETISKYHIFFIQNVGEFLHTLDRLEELQARAFILSHCEVVEDIHCLIQLNRKKVEEICNKICMICETEKNFEEILKEIFETYHLVMNLNQYVLVGSTIKSYLSYLCDTGKIQYSFRDNQMLWKVV